MITTNKLLLSKQIPSASKENPNQINNIRESISRKESIKEKTKEIVKEVFAKESKETKESKENKEMLYETLLLHY